ncbi:voltage-dependent calcium channel gamma-4 subunit-like isoform 2-T4 [Salvelinus alpinus]|uniref:voltage-dependent calcium channel gamma-4 subunit-like isoform X2 n=1 Tax=Salvelinus alpinus TaxID=8036 RepID=UPI0039FCF5D6
MEAKGRGMPQVMVWWEKGIQVVLTTLGAFAAFSLMAVAIGTDYWLYARAFICNSTANSSQDDPNNKDKKDPGALTHSGLWRICCLEGLKRGVCSQINHFPDDADYDQDAAEYLLRLSNIIGVIVYISAALSDISPKKDEDKKWHYSYGWSFYFGGLSFILAEMVGVLAVNIYIEKNKELRCRSRTELFKSTTNAMLRLPSYRFRRRSRSSSHSTDPPHSPRDTSPTDAKSFALPPSAPPFSVATLPNPHHAGGGVGGDISMYTLTRDSKMGSLGGGGPPLYGTVDRASLYQLHSYFPNEEVGVMMSGTLPSLSKSNLSAAGQNATVGGTAIAPLNTLSSSGPTPQQPPLSTGTMERERGMGTLDRLGGKRNRDTDSDTLNRRTTPV